MYFPRDSVVGLNSQALKLPSSQTVAYHHRRRSSSSQISKCLNTQTKMQNEEGVITELYIPRKCSATNRLITSKDHASVQVNVGHLDENGVYNGHFSTFALCGFVRAQGDADSGLDRLWQKKKAEIRQQ